MSIKKGLAGLILGFGALSFANETYAQETPETPIIEQREEKTYQVLEQELRSLLQRFIGHDKSLLPTLEQKLEETKSRLHKETQTPSDLSAKLNFLDTVKRDLDDYKAQFSIYEETFKTFTDMLDSISEGKEVPGFAAKISFINRTKIKELTNPYLMAPKQDLFNLIDEIYKAEANRKQNVREKIIEKRTSTTDVKTKEPSSQPKTPNGNKTLEEGLVGYWSFDAKTFSRDGKFVADLSGSNNHGKLCGSPKIVPGVKGEALEFDGDDYIENANYSTTDNQPISVFAYINVKSFSNWQGIITNLDAEVGKYPGWVLYTHGDNTLGTFLGAHRRSNKVLTEKDWYHVGFAYNGNDLILYINGEVDKIDSDVNYGGNNGLRIGRFYFVTKGGYKEAHFDGIIDEVKIFNGNLSAQEVKNLYYSTKK